MNNEHVLITGKMLCLVPYLPHHVPRYHEWMCSEELRESTASEQLTLEREYSNQREWLYAEDKLTFIILAPLSLVATQGVVGDDYISGNKGEKTPVAADDLVGRVCNKSGSNSNSNNNNNDDNDVCCAQVLGRSRNEFSTTLASRGHAVDRTSCSLCNDEKGDTYCIHQTYVMVGDCNLFCLNKYEVIDAMEGKDFAGCINSVANGAFFEVSVMVADCAFRRMGVGEEALRLIMSYAIDKLNATCFVAKVLKSNTPSTRLFTSKLNFKLLKDVPVFNELHLVKYFVSEQEKNELMATTRYELGVYNEATEREMTVLNSLPAGGCLLLK